MISLNNEMHLDSDIDIFWLNPNYKIINLSAIMHLSLSKNKSLLTMTSDEIAIS